MGSLTTEAPGAGQSSRLLAFLYAHGRYPPPPVGPVYCDGALGMEYPLQDKILSPSLRRAAEGGYATGRLGFMIREV